MITLYHGASNEIELDSNRCLYLTPDIEDARSFALRLDDCGNYSKESFIYAADVDENDVIELDFDSFDAIGYVGYNNMPEVVHNAETDWYCIKHPSSLRLVEHYLNEL